MAGAALHTTLGRPIWLCRALVELTVLALGWLLGGTVGVGTVLFALLIGPLVHVALPLLDVRERSSDRSLRAHPPVRAGSSRRGDAAPTG